MTTAGARRVAASVAVVVTGCQLATDFRLTPVAETDDALCSDGRDNDFNGLVDCQDWSCLGQLPCCEIPELIADDDFSYGPACDAATCLDTGCRALTCGPDPEIWHTWPCPYPRVCDGALRIEKTACFDAGVTSKAELKLDPGLRAEVDVVGAPERMGYLEVGLTLQEETNLPGATDACGSNQRVTSFATAKQVATTAGYHFEAQFQGVTLATSPEVTDTAVAHTVSIGLLNDRRLFYALDGVTFGESQLAVPDTDAKVHLALNGLTQKVSVDAVRIYAGLRCRSPAAFALANDSLEDALLLTGETSVVGAWDGDEVFLPAVGVADGRRDLYFTGCRLGSALGTCDLRNIAIGRAISTDGAPFVRDPAEDPFLVIRDLPGGFMARDGAQVDLFDTSDPFGILLLNTDARAFRFDPISGETLELPSLETTEAEFDAGATCCPATLYHEGVYYLYYAGRPAGDSVSYRIGLTTSTDGITFVRRPTPVIGNADPKAFDGAAATNPTVAYDARRNLFVMWYEGVDFFGVSSIGHAVSADGFTWSAAPGNPVLRAESVGLATVGGPEVILQPDGRLQLLVHGTTGVDRRRSIYLVTNDGALMEQ